MNIYCLQRRIFSTEINPMIQVSRLILYLNNHDPTIIYKINESYDNYFAIVKK